MIIETIFNEIMERKAIVPGQVSLSDAEMNLLSLYKEREKTFSNAKKFKEELAKHEKLSYYLA